MSLGPLMTSRLCPLSLMLVVSTVVACQPDIPVSRCDGPGQCPAGYECDETRGYCYQLDASDLTTVDAGRDAGVRDLAQVDTGTADLTAPDLLSPDLLSADQLSPDLLSADVLAPDSGPPDVAVEDASGDAAAGDAAAGDASADATIDAAAADVASEDAAADAATADALAPDVWIQDGATAVDSSLPGCTDDDGDSFGTGIDCAGLDCDDDDADVHDTAERPCYTAANPGTVGVGICQAGYERCIEGKWGDSCTGEVLPAAGEACNGQDDDCDGRIDEGLGLLRCGLGECAGDLLACPPAGAGVLEVCPGAPASDAEECDGLDNDCDGAIDEDCTNSCVWVTRDGAAPNTDTELATFASIQEAIDYARPGLGHMVCVVAEGCAETVYEGNISMSAGVHVLGGYDPTLAEPWRRCDNVVTVIQATQPAPAAFITLSKAVTFEYPDYETTVLDSFEIRRADVETRIGVEVSGAENVVLSNIIISEQHAATVTISHGVRVRNGGMALIANSQIIGGMAQISAAGVHVSGGKVELYNNCGTIGAATGRCEQSCSEDYQSINSRGIFGALPQGAPDSVAVYLEDAEGSVVDRSRLCSFASDKAVGLEVTGASAGIVLRRSNVGGSTGLEGSVGAVFGARMKACRGAAPWLVDNARIETWTDHPGGTCYGIESAGDCHPVIEDNAIISSACAEDSITSTAIACGPDPRDTALPPSRCEILGNRTIDGSASWTARRSVGISCVDGGCGRVVGNGITASLGDVSVGVELSGAGPWIDSNQISAGCADGLIVGNVTNSTGLIASNAYARLQNNAISAGRCSETGNGNTRRYVGLHMFTEDPYVELDAHSNFIDGRGAFGDCLSMGVEVVKGGAGPEPVGIFCNNIIFTGTSCQGQRIGVREQIDAARLSFFEHNNVFFHDDGSGTIPSALYSDADGSVANDPGAVDALGPGFSGTLSDDPLFEGYPSDLHIGLSSPCDNSGTPTAAPLHDMEGDVRDPDQPDIGPDENLVGS